MNPNIALSFQRPRFDPGEGQRNALAMRNAQMQEAAGMMALQNSVEDRQLKAAQRNALAGADFSTKEGLQRAAAAAGQSGNVDLALKLTEAYQKSDEAGRARLLGDIELFTKAAPGFMNPETYEPTYAMLAQNAPGTIKGLPPTYDERYVPFIEQSAMGVSEWRAAQDRERKFAFDQETTPTVEQRMAMSAARGGGAAPYYQFLPTDQGYAVGNARTGDIAPASIDGQPVVRATDSPTLQGEIAGSKTTAVKEAELIAERKKQITAARASLRKTESKAAELKGMVSKAIGLVDKSFASGFGSGMASKVRGSSASNLKSVLTTIKANLGFAELQAMRDASPTGGALGQVAVQELEALQSTIASLDQAQSDEQLREHLQAIDQHLTNWQNSVNQAYQEKFEGMQFGPPPVVPETQPAQEGMKFLGFE